MAYTTIIPTEALARRLDDPAVVIVDCRFTLTDPRAGYRAFLDGHIAGAVHADLDRDLAAPVTPNSGRHPLPDPDQLAATFGRLGIGTASQVVAYDDAGGALAARTWWLLRWLGHSAVAVLDGGYAAWQAAGLPTESGRADVAPQSFSGTPDDSMVVTTDEIVAALDEPGRVRLVDVRAAERFRGDSEPIDPVAGHVPGAVNLPFSMLLDGDGRFADAERLRAIIDDAAGVADAGTGTRLVAMCGSGVTACHLALAAKVAGIAEPLVYVGSWSEWIRDPARPIAGSGASAPPA